jgi:pyrophosphatase PpaX
MANDNYEGILFDLDGTLVDSLELILSSYRHTMSIHLGHVPPDEAWLATMGTPLRKQLQSFTDSSGQLEAMYDTYVTHNKANHDRLIRSFPGMADSVELLRRAGYRLAVVTSKIREHAMRELRTCGIDGFFDMLVSANDVQRPKPDPQPVQLAIEGIDVEAHRALMVGDSLYDLLAARAAGVDAAAALWGPFERAHLVDGRPAYWLDQISDLLVLLDVTSEENGGG